MSEWIVELVDQWVNELIMFRYMQEIANVLAFVNRQMILILKTNDLLRNLETSLGTSSSMSSFIQMSRSCVSVLQVIFIQMQSYSRRTRLEGRLLGIYSVFCQFCPAVWPAIANIDMSEELYFIDNCIFLYSRKRSWRMLDLVTPGSVSDSGHSGGSSKSPYTSSIYRYTGRTWALFLGSDSSTNQLHQFSVL